MRLWSGNGGRRAGVRLSVRRVSDCCRRRAGRAEQRQRRLLLTDGHRCTLRTGGSRPERVPLRQGHHPLVERPVATHAEVHASGTDGRPQLHLSRSQRSPQDAVATGVDGERPRLCAGTDRIGTSVRGSMLKSVTLRTVTASPSRSAARRAGTGC